MQPALAPWPSPAELCDTGREEEPGIFAPSFRSCPGGKSCFNCPGHGFAELVTSCTFPRGDRFLCPLDHHLHLLLKAPAGGVRLNKDERAPAAGPVPGDVGGSAGCGGPAQGHPGCLLLGTSFLQVQNGNNDARALESRQLAHRSHGGGGSLQQRRWPPGGLQVCAAGLPTGQQRFARA